MTRRASLEEKGTRCRGQAPAAMASGGKRRDYAKLTIILVASLALATAVSMVVVDLPASMWYDGKSQLLPIVDVTRDYEQALERDSSTDYATPDMLHSPAKRHLHPSTLALSGYPAVGGGAAELIFTVTYVGDMRQGGSAEQGSSELPVVRLDITGSEYRHMYRVTNITSNIGTANPAIFEPYDHLSETVRAERGTTYTVRAMVEFVAEGLIPVYALGFDGDVVTIDVAASELVSMPYSEYRATRQDYLDSAPRVAAPSPMHTGASVSEKQRAADPLAQHPFLSSQTLTLPRLPASESSMQGVFTATGTVMTENATGEFVPVHGIWACIFDRSSPFHITLLNTTAGKSACGYTNADGVYEIANVSRDDPDDMTGADVFVTIWSYGYGGTIDLKQYDWINDEYRAYYAFSNTTSDYDKAVLVNNFNFSDADLSDRGMAGAARIISTISDGMAFFEEHGQEPVNLIVLWNHMSGSRIFSGDTRDGAAYLPGVGIIVLDGDTVLTDDDSYDRHVILHEFGHHVHLTHDPRVESDCSNHSIDEKYDEACAWVEGWAELVPHLVDESATVSSGVRGEIINIEAGHEILRGTVYEFDTFEASGRPVGEKVEGRVAAAMWDMADSEVDATHDKSPSGRPAGADNTSVGVDVLLDVFFAGTYDNFADFYDRWEIDMRHDSAESIAILHGMSFSIPNNTPYYGFVGELDGVFKRGLAGLTFQPNYIDVSGDGSTIAVTSLGGRGLQMINATAGGKNLGLHAAYGYDYACTLKQNPLACLLDNEARASPALNLGQFSSMDGIAFGRNSSLVLVPDGSQHRVHVLGSDGGSLGRFGSHGDGDGEFSIPSGIAFLPNDNTAAIADALNRRIQTFDVDSNGNAHHVAQFESYSEVEGYTYFTPQQLTTDHNGTLYAADYNGTLYATRHDGTMYEAGQVPPGIWIYPSPHDRSNATLIEDLSLSRLGGIAVDPDGLVYVSDSDEDQATIRVYDPTMLLGDVDNSTSELGGRPLTVFEVQDNTNIGGNVTAEAFIDEFGSLGRHSWQLGKPLGIALSPPDSRTGDVRVYVADLNGIKIYERDRATPRVESVWAHTPDGTVVLGGMVEIAVNFSERVTVTGTPTLALETGVAGSSAVYVSGSGSHTLTFNYTVNASAGQSYIDYVGIDSLSLGGGDSAAKIVDGSGNAANLTLPERGTAGSLAANAALWIDASPTGRAPFSIAALATVEAVENQQVRFDVSTTGATPGSYSLIGAPAGAAISSSGAFTWTPGEAQDGVHAFVVRASAAGDPGTSHARTFRIAVAEDNAAPVIEPIPDMQAFTLSELRFNVAATDGDLPAQTLAYCLGSTAINFATVLPNGTFVWMPSKYDVGTTAFNVSIADGFACNDYERDLEASVVFSVTVIPKPPSVYALAPDESAAEQPPVYTAGQVVRIAAEFPEPVAVQVGSGGGAPYLELQAGAAGARAPYVSGSGTSTLVFAYTVRDGDATDRLSYNGTGALALNGSTINAVSSGDPASTVLTEPGSEYSLSNSSLVQIDALRPTVVSVYAPAGDGEYGVDDQIDIAARFSENVTVAGTPVITLETGPADRNAAYRSGNATDTLVFRYTVQEGDIASRLDYTGTDALKAGDGASIVDAVGNAAVLTLPTPGSEGSLGNSAIVSIGDGHGGPAGNNVTVNIGPSRVDGSGNVTNRGDEARVMINVGSLAAPGGAGTATFPPGGAVVRTSFASVSFPPGVTAMSVPADGLLVMYVADDAIDNSSVQGALGYDGSGPVVLQRVVEIGDEDARIVFDMPVRISLEGQASGRAFYAAGAGGAITPIDRACAADDTERVHRQLDRTGECQIDAGGDKVVYTYHLTRFGTAMSGSGAPPPVNHTCSMRVASADLDVRVSPDSLSTAAPQSVINSGSLPFDSVGLEASPWYINLGSAQPGPDTPSLPASITMVSEAGDNGPYRQVNANGTGVAEDLGGGQQASLWFKMDLSGQDGPQSGNLVQYITYVAECVG